MLTKNIAQSILVVVVLSAHLPASAESADVQAVIDAENAGCVAYQNSDLDGIGRFLADDFTLTDSQGNVETKKEGIEGIRSGEVHYTTFYNKGVKVRLYGKSTAVVLGQTVVRGTYKQKPFDLEVQFTDTMYKIGGQWRLVAGHVSRLIVKVDPNAATRPAQ